MKLKSSFIIATSALLGFSAPVMAASITWGTPTTIAADTDVSTNGTLLSAYCFGAGSGTINTVAFTSGSGQSTTYGTYFGLSTAGSAYAGFGAGAAGTPYQLLSTAYKSILGNGKYGVKNATVTLKSLTPGHQYAVQFWSNDSRAQGGGNAPVGSTVSLIGGNTVNLSLNSTTSTAGGLGQHSTGTFVADDTTQAFTLGSSWGDCYINAIQLRDLGAANFSTAGYWNGTGGATWDAGTTASWSLNNSTAPLSSGTFGTAMTASSGVASLGDNYFDNGNLVAVTQNSLTIAAGGVSCTTVKVLASAVAYTLNSADANGISGSTALAKTGSSMLTLAGANTYTGATTVNAGSIRLGHASALAASPVTVSVTNGLSFASGIGTFTLGNLAGASGLALVDTAAAGVTLQVGNGSDTSYSGGLSGTGGALIKQGSGALTLTGGSSITGTVAVNGGNLIAHGPAADGVFPNVTSVTINNGGTLTSGSNGLFGFNNHPVPVTVNAGGTLTVDGGSGGPNMFGSLTLAGGTVAEINSVHTTYGSYNFGGASITATGATTSTLSARDFQFRNAATTVQVDAGSTLNVTGYFSGLAHATTMTLNKTGAGKLILASATASSHGATNVNNGTLQLTGVHGAGKITVAAGATLSGTGTTNGVVEVLANAFLTMADNTLSQLTLNSSASLAGTITLEISKDTGTPAADKVYLGSNITYGGTLTVANITTDSNVLAAGDSFKLFDAATYSGGFVAFNLPPLPAGLSWDKSKLGPGGDGTISVISAVSTPVFTPPGGGYAGAQSVTISSDSGSTIYYTLDGSTPNLSSTHNFSPITGINIPTDSTRTIRAFAIKSGQANSAIATADYTTVTTPTWTEPFGGNWDNSETINWLSGVVGNGAGVTADFSTLTLDADSTVLLTAARTIGHLRFGDVGNTYPWTLAGSGLTLAGTTPSITVNNQQTTISAPIDGLSGLTKQGGGILRLATNESYTGNTVVNAGTLELAAGGAAYTNSTLQGAITVNSGATCSLASTTALGWGGGVTDINLNGGQLAGVGPMAFGVSYHLTGGTINTTGAIRMGVLTGFPDVVLTSSASGTTSVINADGISLATTFGQNSLAVTVAQGSTASGVDLQINAPISGGYSLVKGGAGNLLLAGANSYGGATTVNDGTLTLNGSVTTATTVNGTATLAGTGNAAGGATIGATAFVAPGGNTAGELHGGAITVNGTYRCQLDGSASDTLTVNGNLTFAASSAIAFSTLAGGATAPAYVIASYTGTLTGTPQVTGIPAGYTLDLNTANQVRIVKPVGYSSWASQWVAGQAANLDYDGDGVPNGIEYFMGETTSGQTSGQSMTGQTISWTKGGSYSGSYGTDYWVETSPSLNAGSWTKVPVSDPGLNNASPLQYTLPAGQPKVFTRLVVIGQ